MRPDLPEKWIHDYVRHGTTTLFAALEVATGKVTQTCLPRHVTNPIGSITRFIDNWNTDCQPFTWTKTADEIIPHATRGKGTSLARH